MHIPVISSMRSANAHFDPMLAQSNDKNTTSAGAMSSWRVYPRVNHRLLRKGDSIFRWLPWAGTSARYA